MRPIRSLLAATLATSLGLPALARADDGIPHLDHVFVIMMENHHYTQVINGDSNVQFINQYAAQANLASNYYAVGHPSLTNYLEIVGGSNFGVRNDHYPDWHNHTCTPNVVSGTPSLEVDPNAICPIAGTGIDAETPAFDSTNESSGTAIPDYDGTTTYFAPRHTEGITIADQLVAAGKTWKTYQESLPLSGADGVDFSDGLLADTTPVDTLPGSTKAAYTVPHLYAAKHNPFAYFASVQNSASMTASMVGFDRLQADLVSGHVPNFSFIAPNQCHDQHGRGPSEAGTGCSQDAGALAQGDATLKVLVGAIKASPAWMHGSNAIVVVWDENDYSTLNNQVAVIVDTNYGRHGLKSTVRYNHFALLKTLEAGFGLDYLNHADDEKVPVMADLFGR